MSTTTTAMRIDDLRRIVADAVAGLTDVQIADALHARGVVVPRDAAQHVAQLARPDGYCLPTHVGDPSRWTAAAVTAVRAAPESDPADGWSAARATLDSDVLTTLTIT